MESARRNRQGIFASRRWNYRSRKIVRELEDRHRRRQDYTLEDPSPGSNPALEVQITAPSGQTSTQYVFERFPGLSHGQNEFLLSYHRVISDYISDIQVIKNGKVVVEKDIEVNHPLRYGGYHFYQSSYEDKAGQYTVLQVVSDTGLYVVYAGYWLLCLGAIWHFWLRNIFSRFRAKNT